MRLLWTAAAFCLFVAQVSAQPPMLLPASVTHGSEPIPSNPVQLTNFTDDVAESAPCDHNCCEQTCRCVCCGHCTSIYVDYLLIQASDADIAFGVPQNGISGPGVVPMGAVGVASPNYDSGVRMGFNIMLDACSSFGGSYTWFDSSANAAVTATGGNVINPLVTFPGTVNAGATAQQATASYGVGFQLADIEHRTLWKSCDDFGLNIVLGGRFANLEQDFQAVFPFSPPDGETNVATEIEFNGGGLRLGLESERRFHYHSPFKLYAKGFANVMAGRFKTSYVQVNQFNGTEATVNWSDDRVVSILEGELGISWTNCGGFLTLSAGYYIAGWFNTVTTPALIQGVRNSNYVNIDDTLAFDGLTGRLELRF